MYEWILLTIFGWFLFIVGMFFRDYAIKTVSGPVLIIAGLSTFQVNIVPAIINLVLGIYIMIRANLEIIEPWIIESKEKEENKLKGGKDGKKENRRRA